MRMEVTTPRILPPRTEERQRCHPPRIANYRDDRDALRDKADVLAGELAGTKSDLDAAAREIDAKDAEIARLRKIAGERAPAGTDQRRARRRTRPRAAQRSARRLNPSER